MSRRSNKQEYVAWVDNVEEDENQVLLKRSTNQGASFGSVKKLSDKFDETRFNDK
jgi:hypothetical protein